MYGPAVRALCSRLGVEYPLIQAPMGGGYAPVELVTAVSNAGGLGSLPATFMAPEQIEAAVRAIRQRTDRPFGINFLLAPPEQVDPQHGASMQQVLDTVRDRLEIPRTGGDLPSLPPSPLSEQLQIIAELHTPVVSFSMGHPSAETVGRLRDSGVFVAIGVTTVDEAVAAVEVGADAVVAQGFEAGGHRFTFEIPSEQPLPLIGTLALVPQVVDAVPVPVIAAGGIMDGRGMAAALALGASAVQMGTRFLTAREAPVFPAYRAALLSSAETATTVTSAFTGRPARGLRNSLVQQVESAGVAPLPWPYQAVAADDIYRAAVERDDVDWFTPWAGQGLRMAKTEQPAAEIVREVVEDARAVIESLEG